MTWLRVLFATALTALLAVASAPADDVRPVQVHIKEREPGTFLVQVRVPKVLPPQAIPEVVLPDGCRRKGERVFLDQPSGWLVRQVYRCSHGLAGQKIGIRYPIYNPSLTTVLRIELLTGERHVHALGPREEFWRVPAADVGAFASWLDHARSAVWTGSFHILGDWVHIAFLLALVLLGGATGSVRLVTAFAAGQIIAVALTTVLGRTLDPLVAEVCVAVALAFVAREVLRPVAVPGRLLGLAAGAGLFHGVAIGALVPSMLDPVGIEWLQHLVLVLGMDATLLVLAVAISSARRPTGRRGVDRLRPLAAYGIGGAAAFAVLMLAFGRPAFETNATDDARPLAISATSSADGLPGSRRVAPQSAAAPIQSYLAVDPFEVRHEVLLRLRDVASEIDLEVDRDGFLEIAQQDDVARRLGDLVASYSTVAVDGRPAEGYRLDRTGFVTADVTGVLPRTTPVREAIGEALVGVTIVYLTDGIPDELTLTWTDFDAVPAIAATVTDPESSRAAVLTAEQPTLAWTNELMESPVPTVTGIAVEPQKLPVPLLSSALLAAAVTLLIATRRGRRPSITFAATRVMLALALVAAPIAQIALTLPASLSGAMSDRQARRILASVLPNVYRAFEFRDEAAVYDRLAFAVTGETLTDVYLQHRRALEMEERGGARARVDAVDVLAVDATEPRSDGGFEANAAWTVGGTVTHFGHRHFRQNRYDTRVVVVPVDGMWKIRSIEVLELERLR